MIDAIETRPHSHITSMSHASRQPNRWKDFARRFAVNPQDAVPSDSEGEYVEDNVPRGTAGESYRRQNPRDDRCRTCSPRRVRSTEATVDFLDRKKRIGEPLRGAVNPKRRKGFEIVDMLAKGLELAEEPPWAPILSMQQKANESAEEPPWAAILRMRKKTTESAEEPQSQQKTTADLAGSKARPAKSQNPILLYHIHVLIFLRSPNISTKTYYNCIEVIFLFCHPKHTQG